MSTGTITISASSAEQYNNEAPGLFSDNIYNNIGTPQVQPQQNAQQAYYQQAQQSQGQPQTYQQPYVQVNQVKEDPILNQFSDEVPGQEQAAQGAQPSQEEAEQSVGFLKGIMNYIKSQAFVDDCNRKAREAGVSPKKVAKTYIGKAAGIVGDSLGIAINTAEIGATGFINLLGNVLNMAISLICRVARGIAAFITGNRTNTMCA